MHLLSQCRVKAALMLFIAICVFLAHPSPLFSDTFCVGGYFTTQVGGYSWNVSTASDNVYTTRKPPSLSTAVLVGGGVAWSGEFLDGQFMFRQNAGFESLIADRFDMRRFSLVNTFAYVPFRTETLSVWVGPQLNLFYIWGRETSGTLFLYSDLISNNIPFFKRRTYGLLPLGTGLALGLDYDVYATIRMSFEAGFHFSSSAYGKARDVVDRSASVTLYEGYVNVGLMYRFMESERDREREKEREPDDERQ